MWQCAGRLGSASRGRALGCGSPRWQGPRPQVGQPAGSRQAPDSGEAVLVTCCFAVDTRVSHAVLQGPGTTRQLRSQQLPPESSAAAPWKGPLSTLTPGPSGSTAGRPPGRNGTACAHGGAAGVFVAALLIIVPDGVGPRVCHRQDVRVTGNHPARGRNEVFIHTGWNSETSREAREAHRTAGLT